MFHLLKSTIQVLLNHYHVGDKNSCRSFLLERVLLIKSFALKTETKLDDTLLKYIEIILNNDVVFDYVYFLIMNHLQTDEILFESVNESAIVEVIEKSAPGTAEFPEAVNPAVIISLITQIVSIINTIKNK